MSFLYPTFLFALLAVMVPVIIHLFDFQKPKKLMFTNVRLLQQLQQSTNKGFKIKHLLVLAARMLFISFLVLAFAQPFIPANTNTAIKGKQSVSIYVDNSLSMQQMKAGKKALDIALSEAAAIAGMYPIQTSFQYLDNNFEAKDQYWVNKEQLKDRLTETSYSPIIRDLHAVFNRQKNALLSLNQNTKNNVFILSDFQKTTIGDLTKLKVDTNTTINLIPIQNENADNVYVDTLWLQNPFIKPKELNHLIVKVKNTSTVNDQKLALKLMIEGVQVSSNSVTVAPVSTQKVDFSFMINDIGFKKCSITFDDSPVTFDNTYYFALEAAKPIKVMTIGENKANYLSKVYASENFFELESNVNNGLNYSALSASNLIALQEYDLLDASVLTQIKQQVLNGASVVLFPSASITAEKANQCLRIFNVATTSVIAKEGMLSVESPDVHQPFFQNIFEQFSGHENMPTAQPLYTIQSKALLKFKSGKTFLSELSLGKGKVYVCASSLQATNSNLASHALFVPIMYKMAILSAQSQGALAYTFNDKNIALKMETAQQEVPVKLIQDQLEIVPAHQWVDGKLNLQLPKLEMKPGFYQLKQGNKVLSVLAFNYGKQESTLSFYSAEALKKIVSNQASIKVFDLQEGGEAAEAIKIDSLGLNLWKYCLALSLLFLLIEIVLIQGINRQFFHQLIFWK
jgi:hypothetical protein